MWGREASREGEWRRYEVRERNARWKRCMSGSWRRRCKREKRGRQEGVVARTGGNNCEGGGTRRT